MESSKLWGSGPPLTAEERDRVITRYGSMRFRSFTWSLTLLPIGVPARTPEELVAAVTAGLLEKSQGKIES